MFLSTIQKNATLKTLFVQFNNITKSGILEIENCIKRFNIPQEIHASWNDIITENRVAAMRTSYRSFNTLHPYSEMPDTTGDSVKWPLWPLRDTNYASELLSTCLQENSSLKELYFRFCITVTPEGAKKVAEVLKVNKILQKLDISKQSIGNDGIVAIGDSLKINNTLQELNIAGITTFNERGKKDFMNAIKQNSRLQKLDLSCGFLTPSLDVINAISSYLHSNNSLLELNLSSSHIVIGLSEMMKGLHENTTLRKLILSDNCFDHIGATICTLLKHNTTLLELDVSNCCIYKPDVEEIIEGLKVNKTLRSLNISGNRLYDDGVMYFSECLQINCTLKKLNLSNSGIYTGKLIGTGIIQSLQQLNISKNIITDEAMQTICNYLGKNNTLLKLGMSSCRITSNGVAQMAAALKINSTLMKLDISCNQFGEVGVISIADSLQYNKTIQKLNLSATGMSSSGAAKIAEALYVNKTLEKLNLSHNILESDGVAAITECLKRNSTLKRLDVSACGIKSLSVRMFAEAIKVNKDLCTLNLSMNGCIDDGFKFNITVLDAMHFNKSIIYLGLPVDHKYAMEIRHKIEAVNKEREKLGVKVLCTSADEEYSLDYYRKINEKWVKLSYL